MKTAYLFIIFNFFLQNFTYANSQIERLKHKDFKEWEEVLILVSKNKLKEAIKENEEIISDLDEDSVEKLNYGHILGFELEFNLKNYEKAYDFLEKTGFKDSLSHRFFRLIAYKRFYDTYHYTISKNNETYIYSNISTWKLDHFHKFFRQEALSIGNNLLIQNEFSKSVKPWLMESDYPHNINTSAVEIITYGIIDLISDQRIWEINEEIDLQKDLQSIIEKKSSHQRKKLNLSDSDSMVLMIYKLFINLENKLWKEDNLAAMLNSKIELVKFLNQKITSKNLKLNLIKNYELFLRDLSIDPWWSNGMALLLQLKLENNDFKVNQDILADLNRCIETFPKSIGANKCRNTLTELKRPRILLQGKDYFNFNLTKLEFETKNIENLYIKIIAIDELKIRSKLKKPMEQIRKNDVISLITDGAYKAKKIEVSNYQEFETFKNKYSLKGLKYGTYLIALSSEKEFLEKEGYLSYKIIQNTPLTPIVTYFRDQITIRLLNSENSKKINFSKVKLLSFKDSQWKEEIVKNPSNLKNIIIHNKKIKKNNFIILESNKNKILIPSQKLVRYGQNLPNKNRNVFISQQKIYRPKEQVNFKIISRTLKKGLYIENAKANIHLTIKDVNNSIIIDKDFDLNSMGSTIGSFLIPNEVIKGKAKVFLDNKFVNTISIEEFKKPNYKIETDLKKVPKNKNLRFKVKVSDYQNRIINNIPVKISVKKITHSHIPYPDFFIGSFQQNKKEKLIYEKVHNINNEKLITFEKELFADDLNFTNYEIHISANYNGESLSYFKRIFHSDSKSIPSIEILEKPFSGNIKFKLSNIDLSNATAQSNKGKLLVYKLKGKGKTLQDKQLGSLFKFFDIGEKQGELLINSIPSGAYRAIYEIGEGKNKVETNLNFVTYHAENSFSLNFKVDQSHQEIFTGKELTLFSGTNLLNRNINIEILKNGKIVKEFSGTNSKLYKVKIEKDWHGHYDLKAYLITDNDIKLHESSFLVQNNKDWSKVRPIINKKLFSGEELKLKIDYPKKYEGKKVKLFAFAYDARLDLLIENKIKIPEYFLKEKNGVLLSHQSRNFNIIHFWDYKNIKIPYLRGPHLDFLNLSSTGGPGIQKGGAMMFEAATISKTSINDAKEIDRLEQSLPEELGLGFFEEHEVVLKKKANEINFKLPKDDKRWKIHIFLFDKNKNIRHFENSVSVVEKIALINNNPKYFSNKDSGELSFEILNNSNIEMNFDLKLKKEDGSLLYQKKISLPKESSEVVKNMVDMKTFNVGENLLLLELLDKNSIIKKEMVPIHIFKESDANSSEIIFVRKGGTLDINSMNGKIKIRRLKKDFEHQFKLLVTALVREDVTNSISIARKYYSLKRVLKFINEDTELKKKYEEEQKVVITDTFNKKHNTSIPKLSDLENTKNKLKNDLKEFLNGDGGYSWLKNGESNLYTTLGVLRFFSEITPVNIKYVRTNLENNKYKCIKEGTCFNSTIDLLSFASKINDFDIKEIWKNILKINDLSPIQRLELSLIPLESVRDDVEDYAEETLANANINDVTGLNWSDEKLKWKYYEDTFEGHLTLLSSIQKFKVSGEKVGNLKLWLSHQFYGKQTFSHYQIYKVLDHLDVFKKISNNESKSKIKIDEKEHEVSDSFLEFDKESLKMTNMSSQIETYEISGMKLNKMSEKVLEINLQNNKNEFNLGEEYQLNVSFETKIPLHFVILTIPVVAGFEYEHKFSGYDVANGIKFYRQVFEDKVLYHFEKLPTGKITFPIDLKAKLKGKYYSEQIQAQILSQGFVTKTKGYEVSVK